ncbi:hypothetical protein [Nocardioides stalactiti]|uniref:hypothetical protein n=1 Tax=Nocardioides stalactiti TaxID=2755356 RepID=UPI001602DE32|nr:hypothetical protein [Nocardioides stalactiti]
MPDGYRLWRTADGDLVPDEHPDAETLAYGTGDPLKPEDADNVRDLGAVEIEGVLVADEPLAGAGEAVNAETGEVTPAGEPLPEIEGDGEQLPAADADADAEKVVDEVTPKTTTTTPRKRKA